MEIKIVCPNASCQQPISVDSSLRGTIMRCPTCDTALRIPGSAAQPPRRPRVLFWTLIGSCGLISLAAFAVWQFHRHHQALARRQEEIDAARQAAVQVNGGPSSAPIRRPSFLTNPLWIIPSTGDLDGLKQMLDKEPNRLNELVGGMRATMLHVAAYKGQPRIVEELLRRHAEVNLRTKQGHTPLYDCIDNQGTAEIAQMLLDSGADATIADQTGKTPLQLASERNKEDIAALLRQRGVKK